MIPRIQLQLVLRHDASADTAQQQNKPFGTIGGNVLQG